MAAHVVRLVTWNLRWRHIGKCKPCNHHSLHSIISISCQLMRRPFELIYYTTSQNRNNIQVPVQISKAFHIWHRFMLSRFRDPYVMQGPINYWSVIIYVYQLSAIISFKKSIGIDDGKILGLNLHFAFTVMCGMCGNFVKQSTAKTKMIDLRFNQS